MNCIVIQEHVGEDEMLRLTIVDRQLKPVSQLRDYTNWGLSLEELSLWEFFRDTYNGLKLIPNPTAETRMHSSDHSVFMNDSGNVLKCRVI